MYPSLKLLLLQDTRVLSPTASHQHEGYNYVAMYFVDRPLTVLSIS